MPTTVDEFEQQLFKIGIDLKEGATNVARKVTFQAFAAISRANPVQTGRSRSNWNVAEGFVDGSEKDPNLFEPLRKSGGVNDAAIIANFASVTASINSFQFNDTVYLSNNTPYIEELNKGTSGQAPAFFVQIAATAAVSSVEGARVL